VGRRILILIGTAVAISLLIVGVATAAGGLAPSDETTISSVVTTIPGDTDTTTAPDSTDTTAVAPDSTDTTAAPETTDATIVTDTTVPGDVTSTTEAGDDGRGDTNTSCTHPANFGGTISSLRHAGDHTPAAEVKGKHVKGWEKKHPAPTTTTTVTAQ
jgi:hypothetical protein